MTTSGTPLSGTGTASPGDSNSSSGAASPYTTGSTTTNQTTSIDDSTNDKRSHANTGAIVGGVVAGVGALVLGALAAICWRQHRQRNTVYGRTPEFRGAQDDINPFAAAHDQDPFGATSSVAWSTASPASFAGAMSGSSAASQAQANRLTMAASDVSGASDEHLLRHTDGGPMVELPPAYDSLARRTRRVSSLHPSDSVSQAMASAAAAAGSADATWVSEPGVVATVSSEPSDSKASRALPAEPGHSWDRLAGSEYR